MIIRRLANGIRDENWFVVFVEIMIVVIGIFIGLQVDDWNQSRHEVREEALYLERLYADLESSIIQIDGDLNRLRGWREQGEATLYALINNTPDAVGGNGVELVRSMRINLSSPRMATINELVMGGRLNIIRDPLIRQAISEYQAEIDGLNDMNALLLPYVGPVAAVVSSRLRPVEGQRLDRTARYDFEALSRDEHFQNQLATVLRLQLANEGWHERMLEETIKLKDFIAPLVGAAAPQ